MAEIAKNLFIAALDVVRYEIKSRVHYRLATIYFVSSSDSSFSI